jgi:hypothetical protein
LRLSDYSVGPVTVMKIQIKTYLLRIMSVTSPATHAMILVLAGSSSSGESSQHIPRTRGKYLAKLLPKLEFKWPVFGG